MTPMFIQEPFWALTNNLPGAYDVMVNRDYQFLPQQIEDKELRDIRWKYWNMFHKAFLDESGIPDDELERVVESIKVQEQDEILKYRQKKGI